LQIITQQAVDIDKPTIVLYLIAINYIMNMNLVDSVLNTPRTNDKMDTGAAANGGDTMDSEEMQVRTMEVPRWLSTPDVTSKFI